ncbi:hypothetical protein [uncultured Rhodoblastus sp.]|uniref:hypothetical protein n=1 Tax=uncultured Rhodoblastus sp. TaxID=543037 RepID=UPI0025CF435C|nr:hypothetical protein [uncultured Rhodoblastus sp.]
MRAAPKVYQPDAFAYRVNYAAQCILRGTKTRASDTGFEMNDGDAVVTALVRRAKNNPKLHAAIASQWSGVFPAQWLETAAKHKAVPTRGLAALASNLRVESARQFERMIAEQSERQTESEKEILQER